MRSRTDQEDCSTYGYLTGFTLMISTTDQSDSSFQDKGKFWLIRKCGDARFY